jgi:hypothetical protein
MLGVEPLTITTVDLHINTPESGTQWMDPDELNVAHCNELIRFLKDEGLTSVAARFREEMGMALISNLKSLHEENLDDPEFSFLRQWHKRRLMELVRDSTAHAPSIKNSHNDSTLSSADTESDRGYSSESGDEEDIVMAAKHPGNPEEFQEHEGLHTRILGVHVNRCRRGQ